MDEWCLDPAVAYLNHGGFGVVPRFVADEAAIIRERIEANPTQELVRRLPGQVNGLLDQLAELLGADSTGCVFVPNATTGTATVLGTLAPSFDAGDEILTTDHRYVAVGVQLAAVAAARGTITVVADVPVDLETVDDVVAAIMAKATDRTRLLLVDSIASPSGFVFPVEAIVAAAHERGIPVLVDAAHAPGQIDVDIDAIGADFWVGNLHKWVNCLRAVAVLHVGEQWRHIIKPLVASHGYAETFHAAFEWTGTFDPVPMLSIPAALTFADRLGWDTIRAQQRELVDVGADQVAAALGTRAAVPAAFRAAMRIVALPEQVSAERARNIEATLSTDHAIEIAITDLQDTSWVRICGQIYNSPADYERLEKALPLVLETT